jgi:DNA invertase Pin-like site-specific DNA recombinase
MNVVGYIRTSTTKQRYSIVVQRARIEDRCKRDGMNLVAVEEDLAISGASMKRRHGLARALDAVRSGVAKGIVVASLDRLSRNVDDFDAIEREFRQNGWEIIFADDGDEHNVNLKIQMAAAFAEYEHARIAERTRRGLAEARAQGRRHGGLALGETLGAWLDGGRRDVVSVDSEKRTVRRIVEMRREGASLAAIVAALTSEGARTKAGGAWHKTTILRVLAREGVTDVAHDGDTGTEGALVAAVINAHTHGMSLRAIAAELVDAGHTTSPSASCRVAGAVSQWEREAAGERTSAAMQGMRASGMYTGGRARYGYRADADGALVEDAAEQATIGAAREMRAAGLSLRTVCAELAARGMLNRSGRPFAASAVLGMVSDDSTVREEPQPHITTPVHHVPRCDAIRAPHQMQIDFGDET